MAGRRLRIGATLVVAAVMAAAPQFATAAPAASVLIRDNEAGRFNPRPPAPAPGHPQIIQTDTVIEPSIAANPSNPLNAVAGYQEGRVSGGGDETNGYATTFDGGKTWTYGELPCLTYTLPSRACPTGGVYDRASDAVVAFGPGNIVEYSSLVFDDSTGGGSRSAMAVNESRDGGKTWSAPVVFQDDSIGGLNDKNWVVVDNSDAAGHHKGRVYVVWDRVATMDYSYCDHDCSLRANWLPNFLPIPLFGYAGQAIGSYPLVLADGSLAVVFNSVSGGLPAINPGDNQVVVTNGSGIVMALAVAAGATPFPAPLLFTQVPFGVAANMSNATRYQRASDGMFAAAIDKSKGDIYVAWDDGRFRQDEGVNDMVFTKSTDNGVTWTPVQRINRDAEDSEINHYGAMIDVSPDGTVHIAYRQRKETANAVSQFGAKFSPTIDTFHQESRDGGATWSTPLKVDVQATNFYYGAYSRAGLFQGDYYQAASSGPYTYIARTEAFPLYPGEPRGLAYVPKNGMSGDDYEADPNNCPNKKVVPSCLTHLHQRLWVAVVGPAESGGVSTSPSVSQSSAGTGSNLPKTSTVSPAALAFAVGALLALAALGLAAGLRPRRRRAR